MYIRQILTATALTAFLGLFGLFSSLPAFADETVRDDSYADFDKDMTVFVEGSAIEEASLPSHIVEMFEVN